MAYSATLGTDAKRVVFLEEPHPIVKGFVFTGTPKKNELVKLASDGTVTSVAASTDVVLGRVVSDYQGNDSGSIRVATPFESVGYATSSGTTVTAGEVAANGFDATNSRPTYKAAASGDWVCGICLKGGATTTEITVGVLRVGRLKP